MSRILRVAVLPAAPVLLPAYAGSVDPVPELRAACRAAVRWLVEDPALPVLVLSAAPPPIDSAACPSRGARLASLLLGEGGHTGAWSEAGVRGPVRLPAGKDLAVLAFADGSARRGEKAPGYVDERAVGYDRAVGAALRTGDLAALRGLDLELGAELLAEGAPVLKALAGCVEQVENAEVGFDDDPFGVQYWVAQWRCVSAD
ncbi:MAG TPA: hypothetical protein VER39_15850 [Nocardioidaceae bacterium]|nr:hypothetical protein [Nocardioidaceae bacterium]